MTIEVVTTLDTVSAKVGLVVMDAIMLHTMQKNGDVGIVSQQKVLEKGMEGLDCVELNEALFHYEKAVGILGQETYLR